MRRFHLNKLKKKSFIHLSDIVNRNRSSANVCLKGNFLIYKWKPKITFDEKCEDYYCSLGPGLLSKLCAFFLRVGKDVYFSQTCNTVQYRYTDTLTTLRWIHEWAPRGMCSVWAWDVSWSWCPWCRSIEVEERNDMDIDNWRTERRRESVGRSTGLENMGVPEYHGLIISSLHWSYLVRHSDKLGLKQHNVQT